MMLANNSNEEPASPDIRSTGRLVPIMLLKFPIKVLCFGAMLQFSSYYAQIIYAPSINIMPQEII